MYICLNIYKYVHIPNHNGREAIITYSYIVVLEWLTAYLVRSLEALPEPPKIRDLAGADVLDHHVGTVAGSNIPMKTHVKQASVSDTRIFQDGLSETTQDVFDDDDNDDDGDGENDDQMMMLMMVTIMMMMTMMMVMMMMMMMMVMVMMMMMMMSMILSDVDSHDGYTVVGIRYHHASQRSATRVIEPATNPPQCSVNRVPPHTRLDREHASTWFGAENRGLTRLPTYDVARGSEPGAAQGPGANGAEDQGPSTRDRGPIT